MSCLNEKDKEIIASKLRAAFQNVPLDVVVNTIKAKVEEVIKKYLT